MIRMASTMNFVVILLLATYFVPSQADGMDDDTTCTPAGLARCMNQAMYMGKDAMKGDTKSTCKISKNARMCLETMEKMCDDGPVKTASMAALNGVEKKYLAKCAPGKGSASLTSTSMTIVASVSLVVTVTKFYP